MRVVVLGSVAVAVVSVLFALAWGQHWSSEVIDSVLRYWLVVCAMYAVRLCVRVELERLNGNEDTE